MSFPPYISSRAPLVSSQNLKRPQGEPAWYHPPGPPSSNAQLEDWEYTFMAGCNIVCHYPTNRQLNEWSWQLVESKLQLLQLGQRGNKDLAGEWGEYYMGHLTRWFPVSTEPAPEWMAAAMRPMDNHTRSSTRCSSIELTSDTEKKVFLDSSDEPAPQWMVDAMRPMDDFRRSPSYDCNDDQWNYGSHHGYNPTSAPRNPLMRKQDVDDELSSLSSFSNSTRSTSVSQDSEDDRDRSTSVRNFQISMPRTSLSPPACHRECGTAKRHYDPDVIYGATLLCKIQRGIPF